MAEDGGWRVEGGGSFERSRRVEGGKFWKQSEGGGLVGVGGSGWVGVGKL